MEREKMTDCLDLMLEAMLWTLIRQPDYLLAGSEVRSLGSSGPFDYEGSDEDYDGPVR